MKYTNFQYILKSPIFLWFRKHYCPDCGSVLKVIRVSEIVREGSEEAQRLGADGNIGGAHFSGNVKVSWNELECPDCARRFTIQEMKAIEGKK